MPRYTIQKYNMYECFAGNNTVYLMYVYCFKTKRNEGKKCLVITCH